jgi:hypothetical protein
MKGYPKSSTLIGFTIQLLGYPHVWNAPYVHLKHLETFVLGQRLARYDFTRHVGGQVDAVATQKQLVLLSLAGVSLG